MGGKNEVPNKPILLIDGDILVYKAIASVEKEVEFQEDLWVMWTDLGDAREAFRELLTQVTDKVDATPHLCLSDKLNFRKDLDPTYKANRKKLRKPMGFQEFRTWVQEEYTCITKPTLEADDVLGILATKPGNNAIIHSEDKDLKQIPGKHLVDGEIITITEEEGDYLHMMQTLTGDAVDGYPGCPGIGPVKAKKILDNCFCLAGGEFVPEEAWDAIKDAYTKAELTEQDALLQARLARILRWSDWDHKEQRVKLWEPIR